MKTTSAYLCFLHAQLLQTINPLWTSVIEPDKVAKQFGIWLQIY